MKQTTWCFLLLSVLFVPGFLAPGTSDTQPPNVADFDFNPKSIDTAYAAQVVNLTAHLTDDLSGIFGSGANLGTVSNVVFASPSGSQHAEVSFDASVTQMAGTRLDAKFKANMTLPRYCETGTWQIEQFVVADQVGNIRILSQADLTALGFATDLVVTSLDDTLPPSLSTITVYPSSVNVGMLSRNIAVTLSLADDHSGISSGTGGAAASTFRFRSPSNTEWVSATVRSGSADLVSGTAQSGVYVKTVTLPRHSEAGQWQLDEIVLVDEADNTRTLGPSDLTGPGQPPIFTVTDVVYTAYLPVVHATNCTPPSCPTTPLPPVDWDQRLGNGTEVLPHLDVVQLVTAQVAECQTYWRVTRVKFEDIYESGNDHTIYVKVLDENGNRLDGQSLHLTSVGGLSEYPDERPAGDMCDCNFGYPMYGDAYAVHIDSALPSDMVTGMIMPMRRHVNYRVTFQRVVRPEDGP